MNLKRVFCTHKNLTALNAKLNSNNYDNPIIELKCNRCGKILYMPLHEMQYDRHDFRINVDTRLLKKYSFFGGEEIVKEDK